MTTSLQKTADKVDRNLLKIVGVCIVALAALFAIAALFARPAPAADLFGGATSDDTGQPHPGRNWSGIWLGAIGGYQISNSELSFNEKEIQGNEGSETVPLGGLEKSFNLNLDGLGQQGVFGELQLGYDQQVSQRIVVGVFGGYNRNNAEFSIDQSSFNAWADPQSQSANLLSFEQEWGGVLGARLGVLKSPDTMFYLAGGWAFGELSQVKSDGEAVFTTANGFSKNQETDLNGWFGELGMETRVHNNIYLTVAGRYTDYSSVNLAGVADDCEGPDKCSASLDLDHNVLAGMVGLKVKFGDVQRLY